MKKTKKELCNSLIQINGTYPYYYVYKNTTNIIYITHIASESDRGISIQTDNPLNSGLYNRIFQNKVFLCDNTANYEKNTITFNDEYKIEVPINIHETVILKSTTDISYTEGQKNEIICTIYEDTLKIAKPYQVICYN